MAALPDLPREIERAWGRLAMGSQPRGPIWIVTSFLLFVALGLGWEYAFRRSTTAFRRRTVKPPFATVPDRIRAVGLNALHGVAALLIYATGSLGAFLIFDWPPLLQDVTLYYLLVALVVRANLVSCQILLAPRSEALRLIPMANRAACYWLVWSTAILGWFFFARSTLTILRSLSLSGESWYLVGLACGLVLLGLALSALWRAPSLDGLDRIRRRHTVVCWLVSFYLVGVWLALFFGSPAPFYIGLILLLLPITIRGMRSAVGHLLRPPGSEAAPAESTSLTAVALERGLRALLLIGAALLVASILKLDLATLTRPDGAGMHVLPGVFKAVIILLTADFAWHLLRAWLDQRIVAADVGLGSGDDARRHARLRTLLPILKNVLFVVLAVMAGLIALAALGVEIGPLVAGAGVVGLAVGFGAQTLVKDVISGMFFLFDDAFRIGEYIESGSIRGTVEGFSLRSLKLRHHRGALHTIPFGALDKITNYSRDWVIDKMTISVTYDTDLDKIKPIVKQVGKELAADPEFAPHILETLKMQGVEQFGDYAIQIRLKMMTKPGEQFVIRRRAMAMIKKAFEANGIAFAFPTVTVAGGASASTATQAQSEAAATQQPSAAVSPSARPVATPAA
ncbi:mechanosensitive ion channel family protein [Inquilinus sp. OTU3971]|uniref:mechanosensitive ion channel family protein n=1 Tax=Inquilinus sp. OTU3971 TaxID=3043855 RepID=UPI00313CA7BA